MNPLERKLTRPLKPSLWRKNRAGVSGAKRFMDLTYPLALMDFEVPATGQMDVEIPVSNMTQEVSGKSLPDIDDLAKELEEHAVLTELINPGPVPPFPEELLKEVTTPECWMDES